MMQVQKLVSVRRLCWCRLETVRTFAHRLGQVGQVGQEGGNTRQNINVSQYLSEACVILAIVPKHCIETRTRQACGAKGASGASGASEASEASRAISKSAASEKAWGKLGTRAIFTGKVKQLQLDLQCRCCV